MTELSCIVFDTWGSITLIDFSSSPFFILSDRYNWDIFTILSLSYLGFMLSTSFWTMFTNSSSSCIALLLKIEFSFWSNFTRLRRSAIYEAASRSDSDLSSSYLSIRAIISLFWFTCFNKESFEVIFISLINFWLAVYSPFLDTLDPAIDPALEPDLDWALDPLITFTCYFYDSYTWHFPIFTSGWPLTFKNNLFLVFYISKLTKSFWILSTRPPIWYDPRPFLKIR